MNQRSRRSRAKIRTTILKKSNFNRLQEKRQRYSCLFIYSRAVNAYAFASL